jgi:uncharacterized protein YjbJ (UPF0337 family)
MIMTSDILSGNWKELSDEVKKQWSKLSDEELGEIGGYKDKLLNALQEKYGFAKNKAEEELEKFMKKNDIDWAGIQEKAARIVQDFPQEFEERIHENPFKSIFIAVGAGLLLGALMRRGL